MDSSKLSLKSLLVHLPGLVFLVLIGGCGELSPQSSEQEKPNIVLLFADDLGFGDLSSYGHPLIQTPNADQLAKEGVRLTSFYVAAPTCSPSRAALLTGRYPHRAGLTNVLMPESEGGLPLEEITLADLLKDAGYRTAAYGKWHIGHQPREYLPTSRGFDEYFGIPYSNDMMPPWVQTDVPLYFYENDEPLEAEVDQAVLTTRYTERAVEFIERESADPFFLYLPYSMPHVPVYPSLDIKGSSEAGKYGDVIETIDWSVGQIMDALERKGVADNTIVIFTSDNGPWKFMPERMFSEDVIGMHEPIKPWDHGSTGLLNGAKATVYEGGYRVPAIIRWPAVIPSGQMNSDVVTAMDLFVTLVASAKVELPDDRIYDGYDVTGLLAEGETHDRSPFFYGLNAVRDGDWKLILTNPDQPELYNLRLDPAEQHNRADELPEKVTELSALLGEFSESVDQF